MGFLVLGLHIQGLWFGVLGQGPPGYGSLGGKKLKVSGLPGLACVSKVYLGLVACKGSQPWSDARIPPPPP